MSLRIVPPSSHPSSTNNTRGAPSTGAPSAPGLHDTLRHKLSLEDPTNVTISSAPASGTTSNTTAASAPLQSSHPLEARLKNWRATQESLKMNLLRKEFGIAEPVRRGMELQICRAGEWRPAVLGGSSALGEDILMGRDTELGWEDVYAGQDGMQGPMEGEMQVECDRQAGLGKW